MCDMLYMQLENERATRDRLLATERTDIIASMLLRRIEAEIIKLEGEIYEQGKEKSNERGTAGGFMADVFKALHRFAGIKNRGNNTVPKIFESTEQQVQAVTQ